MNYANIKECDIANGPGVRVSLFVSGCRHHCKGCFNAVTWDFHYGEPFTERTAQKILDALKPDYIQGFSLLGGEPFEPENQQVLVKLLKQIRKAYPQKDIWCYTGYTYDTDLQKGGRVYTGVTDEMLSYIDLIVDGEFVEAQKDVTLLFRGSRNQRLIGLHGYHAPEEPKRALKPLQKGS
ncbi:MAG: anaerobic ribonucleoside-triphosphate reductase activating protein [Eubacterium sp.]|nr:anaerobic ribonucleoside-triphosphate reductase activating protein [Eubacterium sp.]